jgi:hypothetical protein
MTRRILFAAAVCGMLYVAAVAVALAVGTGHVADRARTAALIVEFGAPAVAAVALLLLTVSFPDLLEPYRFAFPINLTAPAVFCAITYAVVSLVSVPRSSIEAPPEVLQPALVWLDWRMTIGTFALQVVLLSGAILAGKRHERDAVPPVAATEAKAEDDSRTSE